MKSSLRCAVVGAALLSLACNLGAQTLFSDNFESGNLSLWTQFAPASPMTIDTAQTPVSGLDCVKSTFSASRIYHNFSGDALGTTVSATAWIYDDSMTRAYFSVGNYSGGTYGSGSLVQEFDAGKFNNVTRTGEVWDGTKYQGRVVYPSSVGGWMNLNGLGSPARAAGWHKFTITREANNTTVDFYVDDVLSRSLSGANAFTWNYISLGFGTSSSSNGNAWFDDVSVVVVPEPSMLALAIVGGLSLWAGSRKLGK